MSCSVPQNMPKNNDIQLKDTYRKAPNLHSGEAKKITYMISQSLRYWLIYDDCLIKCFSILVLGPPVQHVLDVLDVSLPQHS